MSSIARFAAATLAATTMLTLAPEASAEQVQFLAAHTAPNICQPALPAYEGQIRKRPLAVQNEGEATAFITCAFNAGGAPTLAHLYPGSVDGQEHSVTCTAVSGYATGNPVYRTKTVTVGPTDEPVSMFWVPSDFGETEAFPSLYFSASCSLPPGTALYDGDLAWFMDIGA